MTAPRPFQEQRRLQVLRQHYILDTEPETCFDEVVLDASVHCDVPMAAFTLLGEDKLWLKASVGLATKEIDRSIALCSHVVASGAPLVVEDLVADERFKGNPLIVDDPGFGFYAGVPVRAKSGEVLGTLCVVDTASRRFPWESYLYLKRLASRVESLLATRQKSSTH